MIYFILFFSAFLSGSLLPMGSEALLIYDYIKGYNSALLLLFASLGNTLGAVFNYYLGLKGEEYLLQKKFIDLKKLSNAKRFFQKRGSFVLLLSPLPIIGDPLTFVAGILQYPFKKFIVIVFFAKFFRYLAIIFVL